MTMNVNVAHRGPDGYISKVTVEDRIFDRATQKYTDDWRQAETFTLTTGQHRDVMIHDTRRVTITEAKAE